MPFKALGLHPSLVQATREMRYVEPTPIQAEAIPAILTGRDLIATAQTGTGKTAAFLLPVLHELLNLPGESTRALVITPTRELAQQIDDVCLGLAYHTTLRVGLVVGGTPMGPQLKALRTAIRDALQQGQLDPAIDRFLDRAGAVQATRPALAFAFAEEAAALASRSATRHRQTEATTLAARLSTPSQRGSQ